MPLCYCHGQTFLQSALTDSFICGPCLLGAEVLHQSIYLGLGTMLRVSLTSTHYVFMTRQCSCYWIILIFRKSSLRV